MQLSERVKKIPPYLFAQIDKKKAEARAKGIDIIDLGIGDPDLQHRILLSTRWLARFGNLKITIIPLTKGLSRFVRPSVNGLGHDLG